MEGENASFSRAYAALNDAQKQAVDAIEGPVLVLAGPGTGKTQLLAVRAGNILKQDSTMLPSNILCLTFTEAAATNMRERLITLIGQDAYHVAIHTFNSFGSWLMSQYPQYFTNQREASTADELTSYRIIEELLHKLSGDQPLAKQDASGNFIFIDHIKNWIQEAKRAGLTPDDLKQVLSENQANYETLEKCFNDYWPRTMSPQALASIEQCITSLEQLPEAASSLADIASVQSLVLQDLHAAQAEAEALPPRGQTKPYTAAKNRWLELDSSKHWIFKASVHQDKLLAATKIYEQYQNELERQNLVDFADQILASLAALERNQDLRYNLQERYQYLMIDEYQDTNRAQLALARYLTDAPVHEQRPNILVVGDDDQAIYRFQGADLSSVTAFQDAYASVRVVTLHDNYRSNQSVIDSASVVSRQIQLSLAHQQKLDKSLVCHVQALGQGARLHEFPHESQHYAWLASAIKQHTSDNPDQSIAVLARGRAQLDALVPYLRDQQVAIDYERRENVLEQPHIVALLTLARGVQALAAQDYKEADALLPEILSHPMWNIAPVDIWQLSRQAHLQHKLWLDVAFEQTNTNIRQAADFLYGLSLQAASAPLEHLLDALIGISEPEKTSASPFKNHYFSQELLDENPIQYLNFLSHLNCLRRHLKNYQQASTKTLALADLLEFVAAYQRAGLTMLDTSPHRETSGAVQLMTVHKAKGQEFDTVFVIALTEAIWKHKNSASGRFSYPANLQGLKPGDNDADDALRLLFVAMTRAKQTLELSYYSTSEDGKAHQLYEPLQQLPLAADHPSAPSDASALASQYEQRWLTRHLGVDQADKHAVLAHKLERYQLSPTHLSNFLDVTLGGPAFFLTQNLLNFPSASAPYAAYGSAMHGALRRAHELVIASQPLEPSDIIEYFSKELARQTLSEHDHAFFQQKGSEALMQFLPLASPSFTSQQQVEVDFRDQGCLAGNARLSGVIDLLDIDQATKTLRVTDYKTGRPRQKWTLAPSAEAYERVTMHRYRQQLLFYALLVNSASDWGQRGWHASDGTLRYVDLTASGKLATLPLGYDASELSRLSELIQTVWQKIINLDFPDTSTYEPTLAGIAQFEDDLLAGKI
jgi:DNA helicase-2/ATP-dependent DNA helicase PcrA